MANLHLGRDFTPPDIRAKVTGRAKYAEDFRADGMLWTKLLLSPMPHARVKSIDTSAALAMSTRSLRPSTVACAAGCSICTAAKAAWVDSW